MTSNNRFTGVIGDDYDLFKLAVPHYDELQDTVSTAIHSYALKHSEQAAIRVIEIGCGNGETTRRILAVDPRITVIAIDNDPKMIEAAKTTLSEFAPRVEFIEDTVEWAFGLMMKPGNFDVVASAFTIHNFGPDAADEVVQEISYHLKSGGLFVNADKYASDDYAAHQEALKKQLDAFKIFDAIGRPDLRQEWTNHYVHDEVIHISEGRAKRHLEVCGFTNIETVYRKELEATIVAYKK